MRALKRNGCWKCLARGQCFLIRIRMEFPSSSWVSKDVLASLLVLLGTILAFALWKAFVSMWLRPRRIKRVLEHQGIKCLPYRLIYGNLPEYFALGRDARSLPMQQISHDIAPRILPHFYRWSEKYGEIFVYWFGSQPRMILTEPEHAKEILSNKFGHYKKPDGRPDLRDLGGNGLVSLEGEKWAQHRRIMNPAFFVEKLKAMTPAIAACVAAMLGKWEGRVGKEDIDVHEEFRTLTADIIAHTAFGSSYAEGKQVFEMQHEQQFLFDKIMRTVYFPGRRFIPNGFNRQRWRLRSRIEAILRQLIEKRLEASKVGRGDAYGYDLLGLMMAANRGDLEGSQKNLSMGIREIMDECKTFFFAGHETTSTLLTWTGLLLASNPEWQERAREEVHAVCGTTELPTAENINNLKIVGMVLNEAIRLYPPAVAVFRQATMDMKLGQLLVPAGTVLIAPILSWHHDPKYWGPDANEFRPDRFSSGAFKACTVPSAYMPFSVGPRNCIGQTFAMLEAKVALAVLLQRLRFRMSPAYRHAPTIVLTMQPQFGMPLFFERL